MKLRQRDVFIDFIYLSTNLPKYRCDTKTKTKMQLNCFVMKGMMRKENLQWSSAKQSNGQSTLSRHRSAKSINSVTRTERMTRTKTSSMAPLNSGIQDSRL